jgi:hypothetical protein
MKRLSRNFDVDGYEVSVYGTEKTRQLLPTANLYSSLCDLPERKYSGITSLHVLEHIDDHELVMVLSAWKKSLLPGGRVICVVPELDGCAHRMKKNKWSGFGDPSHINLKSGNEWKETFLRNGFSVLRSGTDGLWDFPYRPELPKLLDMALYGPRTLLQFIAGRMILREGTGESLILLLEATTDHMAQPC